MAAPVTPAPAVDPAPLLGRDATTARVAEAARSGPGVVVCGVQGMGRTSVLTAARRRLVEAGARVVALHPAEPGSPPFAALAPLLGDGTPTVVDAASLAAAADALVAAVGEAPFVVVADDIDTLARPDAVVLHQLVASGRAHLLASVALDRPPPSDGGAWWWDLSVRVELVPLERAEADQLAEALVGGPIDAVSRERLWDGTRGNPGWLTAVVAATREGGWSCPAGLWTLDEQAAGPADAAVLAELSALPADARAALEALALAERLPIEAAESLAGPAALVAAERRGLVRTEDAGDGVLVCEVAGRLVSSALRGSLDPVVRARRWGRVAEVLDRVPDPTPATTLVRGLALAGADRAGPGAADADLDAVLAAAAAGHTLSRWEESADLADRVWRARADDEALGLITLALGATGDHDAIRALSEELHRSDVAAAAVPLHAASIAISQFHTDDPEGAFATVERARAVTPGPDRGDLDVLESRLRSFAGDQDAALDLAAPWCDGDDPGLRVEALTVRASVAGIRGDGAAAVAGYDEALGLALSQGDAPLALAGTPYLFRLSALADLGRLDEAIAGAEAVRPDVLRDADATAQGWLALHLGRCHLAAGRPRTAARLLAEAVHDLRPLHRPGWLAHPAAALVAAHAAAGDRAAAVAAREVWAAIPSHAVALFRPEELRLVAWLDAAEGDLRTAADRLAEARDRARAVGSVPYEVAGLHDLVRLLPGPARSLAARDLEALDRGNPLVAAHAAQARALVDGSPHELAAAARTYEGLGARLDAAETWAEAGRRTDDERDRAQAGRHLAELVGSEGVSTPLLSGVEERPPLTDREQEIAGLVADGASRREVAEHLVVSVRTIDSHLQRVYRKLGVRGRDELVAVLGRSRPRR